MYCLPRVKTVASVDHFETVPFLFKRRRERWLFKRRRLFFFTGDFFQQEQFLICSFSLPNIMASALTYNGQDGFLDGILRGYYSSLLNSTQYLNFTQCETLEGKSLFSHILQTIHPHSLYRPPSSTGRN